jgi:hypothetical protein
MSANGRLFKHPANDHAARYNRPRYPTASLSVDEGPSYSVESGPDWIRRIRRTSPRTWT